MPTTPTTTITADPAARRGTRRAIAGLALAALATGAAQVVAVEVASAGVQMNHNEAAGRDRLPSPSSGRRRQDLVAAATAAAGLATTAAVLALPAVDVTIARIAVNHNETPGRDRRS